MKIIMFGPPGSGKGTQAKMISEQFQIQHISTGDLFRQNINNQTALGQEALEYYNTGQLVPDEIINKMVEQRLEKDDCKNKFILDGYPRSIKQAEALGKFVDVDVVLDIQISDHEIVERITGRRVCQKCGANYHIHYKQPKKEGICDACGGALIHRTDDVPDTILKRLETYHEQTEPLKDYYTKKEILRTINGSQDIDAVFAEIMFNLKRAFSEEE